VQVLASCHSLVTLESENDALVGDPLEKATINAIDWNVARGESAFVNCRHEIPLRFIQYRCEDRKQVDESKDDIDGINHVMNPSFREPRSHILLSYERLLEILPFESLVHIVEFETVTYSCSSSLRCQTNTTNTFWHQFHSNQ
jgi:magnesium-transporting ATPase (P-type)